MGVIGALYTTASLTTRAIRPPERSQTHLPMIDSLKANYYTPSIDTRKEMGLKYVVQIEIDPDVGAEIEGDPAEIEEWMGKWQALNPIGMYFAMTRRAVTVLVDVPNEDALLEPLHATWVFTRTYPEVWPVADASEFPSLMRRVLG